MLMLVRCLSAVSLAHDDSSRFSAAIVSSMPMAWRWPMCMDNIRTLLPCPRSGIAVLGLGSFGQRLAEVFASLGYQVNGWSRGPHDLPGVTCYHDRDQLADCLAPLDYVVCVLPETRETRDIIDIGPTRLEEAVP
jgi:D-isomer specific 2-hydroxyacid dehydrogenase, NAD binding domain